MNKNATATVNTIAAADNFAEWLRDEMKKHRVTCDQLARAIGYERKSIVNWTGCKSVPRLDAVAAIFAYFDKNRIEIEINPRAKTEE